MLAPIDYQRLAGGRVRFVRREKTYSVRDSFGRENARILLKRRVHRAGRDRVFRMPSLMNLFPKPFVR